MIVAVDGVRIAEKEILCKVYDKEEWELILKGHEPGKNRMNLPKTPHGWLEEIAHAYLDAVGVIPFGPLADVEIKEQDLFHLAPAVCIKLRGLPKSAETLQKATEAALSSYVATAENVPELTTTPQLSFAFCYLASHFGLGLIDAQSVNQIMEYVETKIDKLVRLTKL